MTKPKAAHNPQEAQNKVLADSPAQSLNPNHLQEASAETQTSLSETQSYIEEVLKDLDYLNLKEKSTEPDANQVYTPSLTLRDHLPKPKLSSSADRLLGILGRCYLKGHIAHFYNLQFEIEKHIKTLSELEDARFIAAYEYLKANPSTEAVFVFENKMVAANRVNGKLIQKSITPS